MCIKDQIKTIRKKWHGDLTSIQTREQECINSLMSYCQNEISKAQSFEWVKSKDYQFICELHKTLKIYDVTNSDAQYCRVGNENDGGYVMVKEFSRTPIAYSFGIGKDVSWDMAIAECGYEVFQYDHTIKKLPVQNDKFHWHKLGITGGEETSKLKRFETLMDSNEHLDIDGMLLKMDIEGCEWEVLENISKDILKKFDQIVIELHGVTRKDIRRKVLKSIEALTKNHSVIHIHGNNMDRVDYCANYLTPYTLEVTLVHNERYSLLESSNILPHDFDRPNIPWVTDIVLGKWNP